MFLDIVKNRRSIRKYKDSLISDEDLEYIIDAGRLAPSGGNEQPWLFGVIRDKKLISELVKCCRNQRWIASSPVVIALCTKRLTEDDLDVEAYRLGKLKEELYDIDSNVLDIIGAQEHQALLAAGNMTLAAAEKGIGSCIVAYVDVYKASRLLKVPNSHLVTYILTLGAADVVPASRKVKDFNEVVFYDQYDK